MPKKRIFVVKLNPKDKPYSYQGPYPEDYEVPSYLIEVKGEERKAYLKKNNMLEGPEVVPKTGSSVVISHGKHKGKTLAEILNS